MSVKSPADGPPKLQNVYYVRKVGSAKACEMCRKETDCCLANADVTDFLYACASHLSDPGFARPAPSTSPSTPGTTPPGTPVTSSVSQAEIDKVKAEYEERQRKKKDAASSKDKDKEPEKSWLSTGMSGLSTLASTTKDLFAAPPSAPPSPTLGAPAAATAKVFVLHRDVFRMRVEQKKKAWQAKDAKERVRQLALPSAPRGGLPSPAGAR